LRAGESPYLNHLFAAFLTKNDPDLAALDAEVIGQTFDERRVGFAFDRRRGEVDF